MRTESVILDELLLVIQRPTKKILDGTEGSKIEWWIETDSIGINTDYFDKIFC